MPRRVPIIVAALSATALLGCALGVAGFALFLNSLDRIEREPRGRADAIVALTGGSQRVEDAIDLLAKGFAGRLLISGVNERTGRDEIARMAPGRRALVECCVDLDHRARNTVGNAAETRRWVKEHGFASLIVVTSNYHMPRTMAELDYAMPDVRKEPHAVVTDILGNERWWTNPAAIRLLFAEYAKFLVVKARYGLRGPQGAEAGRSDHPVPKASR